MRTHLTTFVAIFGIIFTIPALASEPTGPNCIELIKTEILDRLSQERAQKEGADSQEIAALLARKASRPVSKNPRFKRDSVSADGGAAFRPMPGMGALVRQSRPDYAHVLANATDYARLANTQEGVVEQKIIKFIWDRRNQQMYFFDTRDIEYHYDFAQQVMGLRQSIARFNRNYQGDGSQREFNLGTLVQVGDTYMVELWNGDEMTTNYMRRLMGQLQRRMPFTELKFHPTSERHSLEVRTATFPVITTQQLYGDINYWPLNKGVAYGYLKWVPKDEDPLLDITTIPVFEQLPLEFGLAAGAVTVDMQTPASHVNIKSMNRGTVNMVLRSAQEDWAPYFGKPVELQVTAAGPLIRELDAETADRLIAEFWRDRKPRVETTITSADTSKYKGQTIDLTNYYQRRPTYAQHQELIQLVGAKSANLAFLSYARRHAPRGLDFETPDTEGVHFGFFDDHMEAHTDWVRQRLERDDLLNPNKIHRIEVVRPALAEIREHLQSVEMLESTLGVFHRLIFEDESSPIHISKVARFRMRGSTNNEDLEVINADGTIQAFTGAGLYSSGGVSLYHKHPDGSYDLQRPKTWGEIKPKLIKKYLKVNASVWNERAFLEREWFGFNGEQHMAVKMGIGLHQAFPAKWFDGEPGEQANSVIVSQNIYNRGDENRLYINSQHWDLAVTNPPTPEELAEYDEDPNQDYRTEEILVSTLTAAGGTHPTSYLGWPIDRMGRTSVKNGDDVLGPLEARRTAGVVIYIRDLARRVYGRPLHVDCETKVFGFNKDLWVKQWRPF